MNVHLTAMSFALQTGRRPLLCPEGVVEQSENWHLGRYNCKGHIAIVAWIQLRHIYHTLRCLFDRLCLTSMKSEVNKGASRLNERDLFYFLTRAQDEMQTWYERFKDVEPTSIRASRLRCGYTIFLHLASDSNASLYFAAQYT